MTLYLTSDLHVDHYVENRNEISTFINRYLPSCDVLCVAGDTHDTVKETHSYGSIHIFLKDFYSIIRAVLEIKGKCKKITMYGN